MKHLIPTLISLILFFGLGVFTVHAQSYVPLAPLPGTTITDASGAPVTSLVTYVSGMIKLLVALGAALAVVYAVIGGTQYVAASINPVAKADALERLQNALIGLAVILSSYLILNSIDPRLVSFNLDLKKVTSQKLEGFQAPLSATLMLNGQGLPTTGQWPDDSDVRGALTAGGINIGFNKSNCTTVGQQGCTSVAGLHGNAISGLRELYPKCKQSSVDGTCNITVNGGTEFWLHRSHNDRRKVDLAQGNTRGLDYYIKKNGVISITECGVPTDPHYQPDGPSGGTYVDEPDRDSNGVIIPNGGRHWHVCY